MKTLVTLGRGGTGKTSFVALMAGYFLSRGETPLLLVDLDPDQNLAELVGIDPESAGKKTVAELLADTFIGRPGTTVGISPRDRIESRIWEEGLFEGNGFDFLSIGTKWVEGCYCMPDTALKNALSAIAKQYRYVIIDSPAGIEHLNRKVTASVDDFFDILGPSGKSFSHLARAKRIVDEVGIRYRNFYAVGSYLCPDKPVPEGEIPPGIRYLGKITSDPLVASAVLAGESLIALPRDCPARKSVAALLQSPGYQPGRNPG